MQGVEAPTSRFSCQEHSQLFSEAARERRWLVNKEEEWFNSVSLEKGNVRSAVKMNSGGSVFSLSFLRESCSCFFPSIVGDVLETFLSAAGARGEADAQNITVLAMWMIEHPGNEEDEEPQSEERADPRHGSVVSGGSGKSSEQGYLQSPGDIPSADATEMEEGFGER